MQETRHANGATRRAPPSNEGAPWLSGVAPYDAGDNAVACGHGSPRARDRRGQTGRIVARVATHRSRGRKSELCRASVRVYPGAPRASARRALDPRSASGKALEIRVPTRHRSRSCARRERPRRLRIRRRCVAAARAAAVSNVVVPRRDGRFARFTRVRGSSRRASDNESMATRPTRSSPR